MQEADWDEYANNVDLTANLYENDEMHKQRQTTISQMAEGKILDVGAGDGYLVNKLRQEGKEADGVEFSDKRIANAKSEYNITLTKGDIRNLTHADGSYDTVIGSEILEHLDNAGTGLRELMRVARKKVIISIPIGEFNDPTHQWLIDMAFIAKTSSDPRQEGSGDLVLSFTRYVPKTGV